MASPGPGEAVEHLLRDGEGPSVKDLHNCHSLASALCLAREESRKPILRLETRCYSAEAMELPIILTPGEDGYLVVECPVIPGCISQGRTREEALANIREAIELCLENRESEGWELPDSYEVAQIKIAG